MSHVPGPYRLADHEPRIYAPCFPGRDALVAIVYGYPKGADPMAWPTARLFVASLDLLAACEAAETVWGEIAAEADGPLTREMIDGYTDRMVAAIKACATAAKMARGEKEGEMP